MRSVLVAIAGIVASVAAWGAVADPYLVRPPPIAPPQGVGCYWYRGVQYCSRYCYWEIDGYRYCQRRWEDAFSQAPYALVVVEPPAEVRRARAPRRKPRPLK